MFETVTLYDSKFISHCFLLLFLFCIIFCPCQPHARILGPPPGIKPTSPSLDAPGLPRKSHFPVFSILFSFCFLALALNVHIFETFVFAYSILISCLKQVEGIHCRRNSLVPCASQFVFYSNHRCR